MHCASGTVRGGGGEAGYDLVMVTSELASMIAGVSRHLADLKAGTT
jgi:hypothetical protein